eukprot:CAMPEP_0197636552 /NCGR_PEP_ID=MMETSP1338-20131121/12020_1 /TAXON_ID=43686 ORGANISM="Pelagodinium beii, Strain RCC1491" /NCGR_SAMPLE_ID=MMETSP1338 /ASSEMBLY_ACC=CAM_ASM_000754 /LENGTH=513 /DNA_ID=CAMNT_0043208797 /DNA_START=177 /DNA_END=1718 /DNA_ORIENTATION=-
MINAAKREGGEFFKEFKEKEPVLMQHLIDEWNHSAWSSSNEFIHSFGDLVGRPLDHIAKGRTSLDVGAAFPHPTVKQYMELDEHNQTLLFQFGNYPSYRRFLPHTNPIPDFLLGAQAQPLFTLGRKKTGSGGHDHEENWVAQLAGRKIWILAPPRRTVKRWPSQTEHACDLYKNRDKLPAESVVCIQKPGEVLYLPSKWYHATCNADEFVLGVGGKGDASRWPRFFFDIQAGNVEAVKDAIAKGENVVQHAVDGKPALHLACETGLVDMVKLLIDHGADQKTYDKEGRRPAHSAAELGSREVLDYLIKSGKATIHDLEESSGYQPLHSTMLSGKWEKTEYCLDHGADINAKEALNGASAIQLAAGGRHGKVVSLLLERRANQFQRDNGGSDTLQWAVRYDRVEPATVLLQHGAQAKGVHLLEAAQKGFYDMTELLLQKRAPVLEANQIGFSPLHMAAGAGHIEIAKLLLEHKADLHAKSRDGLTPVQLKDKAVNGPAMQAFLRAQEKLSASEL